MVNGMISGINTQQVITALLQAYAQPIQELQNQQSSLNSTASDYQTLVTDMQAISTASATLNTSSQWNLMSAQSSNSAVATAQAAAGAQSGSMTFTVNNLAQANVLLSQGSVASVGSPVAAQSSFLLATGAEALGLGSLSSSSLALGSHSISVTQSSASATTTGSALTNSTVITAGANDTLNLTVNGTAYALTIAAGTYSASQLAAAINTAAGTASAPMSASVNSAGELTLATNKQGSAATLAVTGGNAETSLGLANSTATGADAVVSVDGTSTTLTSVTAGQAVTLNAPTGTISAQVGASVLGSGALIGAGTAKAAQLASGSGTLSDVMAAINGSGLAVTASAVEPASGQYRLQVSADGTGLAGAVTLDPNAFTSSSLGSFTQIATAADASVSVGGASGYTLTSSTDTFNSIIPGTSVTVAGTGSATVTVTPDAAATAKQVSSLVDAANQALNDINALTAYNAATKTGGPLMGSPEVNSLRQQVLSIFATSMGTSSLGNSADVGISVNSNGTLSFDQTKFEQAFSANPSGVTSMFAQGGTFAPTSPSTSGQVSLVFAGTSTMSGSYDVSINQSATQASDSGATLSGGAVSVGENLTVSSGGTSVSYATTAGESLANIASGLNAVFGAKQLGLSATTVNGGQQLQVTSNAYGSAASFSITSDTAGSGTTGLGGGTANVATTYSGTDVAGTINGAAATGTGQVLAASTSDQTLNGLSVLVTTPGVTSTTDLGQFTYTPGIAQQLVTLASEMTTSGSGALASEVSGLKAEATGLNTSIANYQALEASQQKVLQSEFTQMETTLGSLKNESSTITGALASIAANGP